MIFSKKKNKKLDPKVRFQHKQFTGKLATARSYKRTAAAVPETQVDKVLNRIGLGSKFVQIGAGLAVLVLLYLIYFPNFLTIEKITITGLSKAQTRDLEIAIRAQIADSVFLYPEKNLFFLRNKVVYDALKKNPSIGKISDINKSFSNIELIITAESKYEQFLVATPSKVYDVYNDGLLKGEAGLALDSWEDIQTQNMIKVQLDGEIEYRTYVQFFEYSLVQYLEKLSTGIKQVPNFDVSYYKFKQSNSKVELPEQQSGLPSESAGEDSNESIVEKEKSEVVQIPVENISLPINRAEVHVVTKIPGTEKTYRVIFDATKDVKKSIENLKLLLSQTSADRLSQLSYIDLRLEERAYLCLIGTACDK